MSEYVKYLVACAARLVVRGSCPESHHFIPFFYFVFVLVLSSLVVDMNECVLQCEMTENLLIYIFDGMPSIPTYEIRRSPNQKGTDNGINTARHP